jgi:hypothetical protein
MAAHAIGTLSAAAVCSALTVFVEPPAVKAELSASAGSAPKPANAVKLEAPFSAMTTGLPVMVL